MTFFFCGILGNIIHNKHLQTVFYVCKAYVRVIVQRQNLHIGEYFFQFFGYATAYYMVWQTPERLQYNKSFAASSGVMDNFAGDKHSFTCIKMLSLSFTRSCIRHAVL